jgi:hypothetical protein
MCAVRAIRSARLDGLLRLAGLRFFDLLLFAETLVLRALRVPELSAAAFRSAPVCAPDLPAEAFFFPEAECDAVDFFASEARPTNGTAANVAASTNARLFAAS